jgi:hypothetical protein
MFEIYRESSYNMKYRVVYFTELGDHNKDDEISRAFGGDHIFDGFLGRERRPEAKKAIAALLERLNDGESLSGSQIERALEPYLA